MEFISQVVCPSEHDQLQDDSNDANISVCDEQSPGPFHDDPFIPDDDGIDDPTFEESGDFDPGDFDDSEHEQWDAVLQAELHTRMMTLRALDQLESDQPLATGSNEELGNTTTDLSPIENLKFTQEFIEGIHTATFENGGLGDNVIYGLRNPCNKPTDISDPDVRPSLDLFLAVA